ncbi:TRAP transporter large permease [Parvularcula dongshanensis]|uniref:Tripartite ATP-independent transporter DctM subunit n=1 Tax=Parvularcula dongshanensis TaxID=1173995 RepID=A0A840I4B8_9PROT|nr:TRAP transporter large permease subunit [Parvularcula dongshanensis]MBB4659121.1 tripartite ATP-independent transporter DctM subunit [Parvularcula dongshanensis]
MWDQVVLCFCACAGWLDIAMVLTLCALLLMGFPAAFTLAGVALLFGLLGLAMGSFDPAFIADPFPIRIFGIVKNQILLAVPLFVLMGVILERAKIAEELLDTMARLFGSMRGGLGLSVMVVGALLAASTGIVGATVVTMGLLSLPTMLKRGYDPALAAGSIAAAGTLGQIIPPSIVLILLGDVMSNAYQESQLASGVFSPETVSVGDLFAGALIPGLVLVTLYVTYLIGLALFKGDTSPAVPPEDRFGFGEGVKAALRSLPAPLVLIAAVLGSILTGTATATEAAAVGALGALLIAGSRRRTARPGARWLTIAGLLAVPVLAVLVWHFDLRLGRPDRTRDEGIAIAAASVASLVLVAGTLAAAWSFARSGLLAPVARQATEISGMVFTILIGAALFSLVFRGLGGDETVTAALARTPGGPVGAIAVVMLVMFLLGFFLDFIEITLVVVPLVAPALLAAGVDPIWLGVMMAVNLQTSFLTPPFGFALFYLRGVAPPELATSAIYKGAVPFVFIQLLMLGVLALVPGLATWLPDRLYGG